ncbi:MAG: hypothetical protein D4R83_06840 [Streptomycetaceae bacterium]|nr:MAG: hypothetical protein D4R83_06840 [Streptomycetaceae bacterium]
MTPIEAATKLLVIKATLRILPIFISSLLIDGTGLDYPCSKKLKPILVSILGNTSGVFVEMIDIAAN